jgi:predicted dehydrogenase
MTLKDLDYLQVDFSDSPKYYEKLRNGDITNPLVLVYDKDPVPNKSIIIKNNSSSLSDINVGVIGAGNYAQNFFIPLLKGFSDINLEGIVSNDGSIAKHIASKNGFKFASTDPNKIFSDSKINTVFILTRHDSHAEYVIKSLSNNKNVFVEKPLALNSEELLSIKSSYSKSEASLAVGYNRRFSPFVQEIARNLADRSGPISVNMMINSGKLNFNHWAHDLETGGGRIIGEMCHFIDLSQFIVKSEISDFSSFNLDSINSNLSYSDTVTSNIKFSDGSISNISYYSNGSASYPKERVEVFSQGEIFVIDDFKTLRKYNGGKATKKVSRQDKGHQVLLDQYFNSLRSKNNLMDFNNLFEVSNLMFKL